MPRNENWRRGRKNNTWPGRNSIPPGIGENDRNEKVKTLGNKERIGRKIMGKVLLLFVGFGALGNNPGLGPEDPARLKLLLLHAVDHVLLLVAGLLPRIVRADDVDLGGGGAPLHHVHYVVRVKDVEAARM